MCAGVGESLAVDLACGAVQGRGVVEPRAQEHWSPRFGVIGKEAMVDEPPPRPAFSSPLVGRPDYLQAIGLVSVEINGLEYLLTSVLATIIEVSPEVGRAIYYSPKAAMARLDILDNAADAALSDNPFLQKRAKSLVRSTRGLLTQRNDIVHDLWTIPLGRDAVHRASSGDIDAADPVDIEDLHAVANKARRLCDRAIVLIAKLTLVRHVQAPSPDTYDELMKWRQGIKDAEKAPSANEGPERPSHISQE